MSSNQEPLCDYPTVTAVPVPSPHNYYECDASPVTVTATAPPAYNPAAYPPPQQHQEANYYPPQPQHQYQQQHYYPPQPPYSGQQQQPYHPHQQPAPQYLHTTPQSHPPPNFYPQQQQQQQPPQTNNYANSNKKSTSDNNNTNGQNLFACLAGALACGICCPPPKLCWNPRGPHGIFHRWPFRGPPPPGMPRHNIVPSIPRMPPMGLPPFLNPLR